MKAGWPFGGRPEDVEGMVVLKSGPADGVRVQRAPSYSELTSAAKGTPNPRAIRASASSDTLNSPRSRPLT